MCGARSRAERFISHAQDGETPLHWAAEEGHTAVAAELAGAEALVDAVCTSVAECGGHTSSACRRGNSEQLESGVKKKLRVRNWQRVGLDAAWGAGYDADGTCEWQARLRCSKVPRSERAGP